MSERFGASPAQSGSPWPLVAGGAIGVAVPAGLWLVSKQGISLDGQAVILWALLAYVIGLALLFWRKEGWSRRWMRVIETLGACLSGPLVIMVVGFTFLTGFWLDLASCEPSRKSQS